MDAEPMTMTYVLCQDDARQMKRAVEVGSKMCYAQPALIHGYDGLATTKRTSKLYKTNCT